jgi:hypothetical protein
MKSLKICIVPLVLAILWSNMGIAGTGANGERSVIGSVEFTTQEYPGYGGDLLAAALPKGVQKLKGGGIKILKGSQIKIDRISRSEVRLSGGALEASDKKVSCRGNCSCDLEIKDFIDPRLMCDGDCDSCSMVTMDAEDFKAKRLEVGRSLDNGEGCLTVRDIEQKIAFK